MSRILALSEVSDFVSGGTPSKSNSRFWGGDIPWVSAKDMKRNFLSDSEDHVTDEGANNGTRLLPAGSTLVLVRGMTLHNYVPICFAEKPLTINQDVKGLIPRHEVRPKFLYYALKARHDEIHQKVDSAGHGTGRLNTDQLRELTIAVPSLDEQDSILDQLSGLDDKIELNRKMNDTLEQMARAIFKSWFVDFDPVHAKAAGKRPVGMDAATAALFPDSFNNSEIPMGWHKLPLDQCANFLNGLALQRFPPSGSNSDLPVIKIAQLRANSVEGADLASASVPPEYIVQDGDVIFSWSGSLLVRVWSGGIGALNQHLFKVTSKDFPKWFYYLWCLHYLPSFQSIAADKATTMGHIQRQHLSDAKVIVPSAEVLTTATTRIAPMLDLCIQNNIESKALAATRDLLLPRLLSGETTIKEAK